MLCIVFLVFSFNSIAQVTEYSPGKEDPSGKFEAYEIDSNNIARLHHNNGVVSCVGTVVTKKSVFNKQRIIEHGIWMYFNEKGELLFLGNFHFGRKEGAWLYFDENRDIIRIITYFKGKEIQNKEINNY